MDRSSNTLAPDVLLARRAAGGDDAAFADIVRLYDAELRRLCFVICGDVQMADDAAQAAWEKAWRGLPALRRPESLRAWLSKIALNESRQVMRHHRAAGLLRLRLGATPALGLAAPEYIIDLHQALARLPNRDRQLLALRYVSGLPLEEISGVLGERTSTTRSRLSRINGRLRKELQRD